MKILSRDTLPLGGFGGLTEHRLVTDSRVFNGRKPPQTWEGLGNFVYLADARYQPFGETGMHSHKELDVISVMVEGRIAHEGSLEHGRDLLAGEVQAQRAGGEGFAHNEINPDDFRSRLLQIWVLPEQAGQPAGYKHYSPADGETTHIYGGDKAQEQTFDSQTKIDIVRLQPGHIAQLGGETLVYVYSGSAQVSEKQQSTEVKDGDLIRAHDLRIEAKDPLNMLVIRA